MISRNSAMKNLGLGPLEYTTKENANVSLLHMPSSDSIPLLQDCQGFSKTQPLLVCFREVQVCWRAFTFCWVEVLKF